MHKRIMLIQNMFLTRHGQPLNQHYVNRESINLETNHNPFFQYQTDNQIAEETEQITVMKSI